MLLDEALRDRFVDFAAGTASPARCGRTRSKASLSSFRTGLPMNSRRPSTPSTNRSWTNKCCAPNRTQPPFVHCLRRAVQEIQLAAAAATNLVQQPRFPRDAGRFGAVGHVQHPEDGGDMRLDGAFLDIEFAANRLVGFARSEQA